MTESGSMEGSVRLAQGDWVAAGYSFTIPGSHPEVRVLVANATVTFTGTCSNGSTDNKLVITLRPGTPEGQPYVVPAGSSDWHPSGGGGDPLSYQGSVQMNVCGGDPNATLDISRGGTFTGDVQASWTGAWSNPKINFRFHYRPPRYKAGVNVDCSNPPTPQPADVCSASWSGTATVQPPDTIPPPAQQGFLLVRKSIGGEAGGEQGEVVIKVTCSGNQQSDFVIEAGTEEGTVDKKYGPFSQGTVCTVSETDANGHTVEEDVTTESTGVQPNGQVTIQPGETTTVTIGDTFTWVPGSLVISKTIGGEAAMDHGDIEIKVVCEPGGEEFDLSIPAATGVGTHSSGPHGPIPAGSVCTATEVQDGSGSNVQVEVTPPEAERTTRIPANGVGTIALTNDYTAVAPGTGVLVVNKTIDGEAAAQHGEITIRVRCGTTQLEDFVIQPGQRSDSKTYEDVAPGATCEVTEIRDGSSSSVQVVVSGVRTTQIPAGGGTGTINLRDTYTFAAPGSGSLVVNKKITGPAAEKHGLITIKVSCEGVPPLDDFVIQPGAGSDSKTYPGIPAGTTCTVTEIRDGTSSDVKVVATGDRSTVVPGNGIGTINLTDTYVDVTPGRGSLVVKKNITGPAAAEHGLITIKVSCGGTPLEDFVIQPGAGSTSKAYENLAADTSCTVTEDQNGSSSSVQVAVTGNTTTMVPGDGIGLIDLTDTYTAVAPGRGSLVVDKTITGSAADEHGLITIRVSCGGVPREDFVIQPGAGSDSKSYDDIPAGTSCSVDEVRDGSGGNVQVVVTGARTTTVPGNGEGIIDLTDTYTAVGPAMGSLVVSKTITGSAAADRGSIRLEVICALPGGGATRLPDLVVAPGAASGSRRYDGISAGSICTVNELQDGSSSSVHVVISGNRTAEIPANGTGTIDLTDTYTAVPPAFGSLVVTKTITGPAAGQQGAVTISVTCGGRALPDLTIGAGASSGTSSRRYDGIPAGSICTAIETANGESSTVSVAVTGSASTTVVAAGGVATLGVTDSYSSVPDSLVVNKTITGPAAGQQGVVTIQVTCNGTALPPFTIPAGAPAGTTPQKFTGLPPGATCTITETADGHTGTVNVTVTGDRQVTIPASGSATARLVDTFTAQPGTLQVQKTIAGNGAGTQDAIRIAVTCDGVPQPDFVIPAGTAAGTVSRSYTGLTTGARCTVTEAADGHTSAVDVTVTGSGQTVTVPAAGTVTVMLGDQFTRVPGSLTVQKTIAGLAAPSHPTIRLRVSCGGRALPDFVIPARTGLGTVSRSYYGLAAGVSCTVTEARGFTAGRRVTVPANDVVTVSLVDTFQAAGRVTLRKTASATRIVAGDTVRFTLVATNRGGGVATNVRVCDRMPVQLVFLSTAGARLVNGQACWTIARLAPGRRRSFTVHTQSYRTSVTRRVCNRATAQAGQGARSSASACIEVLAAAGRRGGVTG